MARADFTITFPERKPGEPDCTEQQRQFIDHLLTEIKADDLRGPALDALGTWQASSLIERLKEIQTGSGSVLASIAFFVAAVLTLAVIVSFIK